MILLMNGTSMTDTSDVKNSWWMILSINWKVEQLCHHLSRFVSYFHFFDFIFLHRAAAGPSFSTHSPVRCETIEDEKEDNKHIGDHLRREKQSVRLPPGSRVETIGSRWSGTCRPSSSSLSFERARDATGKLSRVVLTRVVRLDLTSFVRPLKLLDNAFRYLSLASEDFPYNRAVFILQSCYEIRLAEKSAWLL